jgi:uncharacterized protein YyaL (SSP411 family)
MPNRLVKENSPYLLQHANNPVDWYPWCEEALQIARQEDKPIFLSVGYAACHWCHVMEHESFEDPITAGIMNEHFVNIKVDREERPDIDSIYMKAVTAMTNQGGWPMSVFLFPDGKPFYGGTYFPPVRRYSMPAFKEVLLTIAKLWQEDRQQLQESSENISQYLRQSVSTQYAKDPLDSKKLEQVTNTLAQTYDWKHGGWGQAPKFPQPMIIEYLIQRSTRGDKRASKMATHMLRAMAKGGMYDVVGGGFSRYSVDERWHTPHFEKMLYDNALLALSYLHAYLVYEEDSFRRVCEETLDFVSRELSHPKGGFFSSLDADSEGEEGKFYVWTMDEIRGTLHESKDANLIIAAYGLTPSGNFEGKNIFQRVLSDEQIAVEFDLPIQDVHVKLAELHTQLFEARSNRVRPATDDKILTFWNALMLIAFAEAGRYLKRDDYTRTAIRNAEFLLNQLYQDGRLLRSWRDGLGKYNAYLEDYASLIIALLALYQTNPDTRWYSAALKLSDEMVAHFSNLEAGFFDTRDDHETLLIRPKDLQDNATPSGNALAATALLQLAAYGDRTNYRDIAESMLQNIQELSLRYPTAFAQWLRASDFALGPVFEVAIVGDGRAESTQPLINALWQNYQPRLITAISKHPTDFNAPALLNDRPVLNELPTAYVCQGLICREPVNSPREMLDLLENKYDF